MCQQDSTDLKDIVTTFFQIAVTVNSAFECQTSEQPRAIESPTMADQQKGVPIHCPKRSITFVSQEGKALETR